MWLVVLTRSTSVCFVYGALSSDVCLAFSSTLIKKLVFEPRGPILNVPVSRQYKWRLKHSCLFASSYQSVTPNAPLSLLCGSHRENQSCLLWITQPLSVNQIISWSHHFPEVEISRTENCSVRLLSQFVFAWSTLCVCRLMCCISVLCAKLGCVLCGLFVSRNKRGMKQEGESWDLDPVQVSFQVSDLCC